MTAPLATPHVRIERLASPAAGAEFSLICNDDGPWRVLALSFTFVTSAAVANRAVRLIADDTTTEYLRTRALGTQAAGLTHVYSGFEGSPGAAVLGNTMGLIWPAHGVLLMPGWRLRTSTDLIDVADQYSVIAALIHVYPGGRGGRYEPGPSASYFPLGA